MFNRVEKEWTESKTETEARPTAGNNPTYKGTKKSKMLSNKAHQAMEDLCINSCTTLLEQIKVTNKWEGILCTTMIGRTSIVQMVVVPRQSTGPVEDNPHHNHSGFFFFLFWGIEALQFLQKYQGCPNEYLSQFWERTNLETYQLLVWKCIQSNSNQDDMAQI